MDKTRALSKGVLYYAALKIKDSKMGEAYRGHSREIECHVLLRILGKYTGEKYFLAMTSENKDHYRNERGVVTPAVSLEELATYYESKIDSSISAILFSNEAFQYEFLTSAIELEIGEKRTELLGLQDYLTYFKRELLKIANSEIPKSR